MTNTSKETLISFFLHLTFLHKHFKMMNKVIGITDINYYILTRIIYRGGGAQPPPWAFSSRFRSVKKN